MTGIRFDKWTSDDDCEACTNIELVTKPLHNSEDSGDDTSEETYDSSDSEEPVTRKRLPMPLSKIRRLKTNTIRKRTQYTFVASDHDSSSYDDSESSSESDSDNRLVLTDTMIRNRYWYDDYTKHEIEHADTSRITSLRGALSGSKFTNLDLSRWDVSNVKNMNSMFYDCRLLVRLVVNDWDTSNIMYMASMFSGCNVLKNIDGITSWDVSSVVDMECMFFLCSSLSNLYVRNWDVSNVLNMRYMFDRCKQLIDSGIDKWNINNNVNTYLMLRECPTKIPTWYNE